MGFIWVPLSGAKINSWYCCFTVVYQMNMWNKHTAHHLYNQLSTFKMVPQGSLAFTVNNVEGRKDLWHQLMHRKWNCCYNVVSIGKLFPIAMATQVWESDHRHCQRTKSKPSKDQKGLNAACFKCITMLCNPLINNALLGDTHTHTHLEWTRVDWKLVWWQTLIKLKLTTSNKLYINCQFITAGTQ
jgi:hypothetical protein